MENTLKLSAVTERTDRILIAIHKNKGGSWSLYQYYSYAVKLYELLIHTACIRLQKAGD